MLFLLCTCYNYYWKDREFLTHIMAFNLKKGLSHTEKYSVPKEVYKEVKREADPADSSRT